MKDQEIRILRKILNRRSRPEEERIKELERFLRWRRKAIKVFKAFKEGKKVN